jgi:hypothetical protein
MAYNSDQMLRSSTTARALWVFAVIFAGLLVAVERWRWARNGHSWTTLGFPVAMLFLFFSYSIPKSRGKLNLALVVIAMGLLSVDLIYTLTSFH